MRISDWSSDVCSSDLDLLVLGAGVGDQREHPRVVAPHLAERPGSLAPRRFLAIGQAVEDLRRGERLALAGKSQGRPGLGEAARPGGAPGDVLLMQPALHVAYKLVWQLVARVAPPRPTA